MGTPTRRATSATAAPSIASTRANVRWAVLCASASVPEHVDTVAIGPTVPTEARSAHTAASVGIAFPGTSAIGNPNAAQSTNASGVSTPSSANTHDDATCTDPTSAANFPADPTTGSAPAIPRLSTSPCLSRSSTRPTAPAAFALLIPVTTTSTSGRTAASVHASGTVASPTPVFTTSPRRIGLASFAAAITTSARLAPKGVVRRSRGVRRKSCSTGDRTARTPTIPGRYTTIPRGVREIAARARFGCTDRSPPGAAT